MSAPYQGRAAAALAEPLRHHATVTAVPRTGPEIELAPDDSLAVTFAEDWSPYAQATVTAALPGLDLDRLDPRAGCRLRIRAGYVYQNGQEDVHPLADLGLRTRDVSLPANTLTLTAASAEALAQDYRFTWNPSLNRDGVNEVTHSLLSAVFGGGGYQLFSDFPARTEASGLTDFDANISDGLWMALDDVAGRTGKRIWCDEAGAWRIGPRVTAAGRAVLELIDGDAGTLVDANDSLTREEWFNSVLLRYRWTEELPEGDKVYTRYGRAAVTSGPLSVAAAGRKAYVEQIEGRRIGEATANKIAGAKLANLATRGKSYRVQAIAAYWLRPGMTVSIQLPGRAADLHLVQSVRFQPFTGLMELVTRNPGSAGITLGE